MGGFLPATEVGVFDLPSFQVGEDNPLLEAIAPFFRENYTTLMVPFPASNVLAAGTPPALAAYQQVEDRVQVPRGSWLVAFSAYSSAAAGFRFSIFDEGRKAFALAGKWLDNVGAAQDNTDIDPALPATLVEPYYVVAPGWLQLRMVNSAAVANDAELLLWFAVPQGVI